MKIYINIFLSLCLTSMFFTAQAMVMVAEDLHSIGPFNLNNNPPDRKKLESVLGRAKQQHLGQGGEKLFALCYSLSDTSKTTNTMRSILFIFNSNENKSLLSGYQIEKKNNQCPKISSATLHSSITKSPVFNLIHLDINGLRASLSIKSDSANSTPFVKWIAKEFEDKKIIKPSNKNYSKEIATNLKGNNSNEYQVDTITSFRAEFNNEHLETISIIYRETY